jgi:hypothetical protein
MGTALRGRSRQGGVMSPLKFLLAIVMAAAIAGCGGGDSADTPETVRSALGAQAQALVAVSPADAANQLMDFAERTFPQFFPGHLDTHAAGPFLFRFYSGNTFLAVVVADGSPFLLNHVYLIGPGFGSFSAPLDVGVLTNFITPVAPTPAVQLPVNKNLTLTVTSPQFGALGTFPLGIVPLPTSQAVFCSPAVANATFTQTLTQALAQAGFSGTGTITSCTFNGSTGNLGVSATVNGFGTIQLTITFSYQ